MGCCDQIHAAMRNAAVVMFAATVVVVAARREFNPADGRHDISMGERSPTAEDRLLYEETSTMDPVLFPYPKVQSTQVCYPPLPSDSELVTITAFNVTDLVGGGHGGYAFVTDGGVGRSNLCLHLKTQRGKGYKFNVQVWGTSIHIDEEEDMSLVLIK